MSEVQKLKDEDKLQYGQMPMVELKDGTKLVQTRANNNFIAYKYGFTPNSAFKRYFGE